MDRAEVKRNLQKLRTGTDPKFRKEMIAVADSLEKLLDKASAGGNARAKKLSKKRRSEIARKAANARWKKK